MAALTDCLQGGVADQANAGFHSPDLYGNLRL